MAALTRLNLYCRFNHYRVRMYFARFDWLGNAVYRCPRCRVERRYRLLWGQPKRVS